MCDNQICQQLKVVINQKLGEGETPDQVIAYLVSRYGEGILLSPPQQGFNLAVWYLPIAALGLGALVVFTFLGRSLRREKGIAQRLSQPNPALDEYRQRVRRDLEERERT